MVSLVAQHGIPYQDAAPVQWSESSFGFMIGDWYLLPMAPDLSGQGHRRSEFFPDQKASSSTEFVPIPLERVPDSWQTRFGDNVLMVYRGKTLRMVIGGIGWLETDCWISAPVYWLRPVDSSTARPAVGDTYLILSIGAKSPGQLTCYNVWPNGDSIHIAEARAFFAPIFQDSMAATRLRNEAIGNRNPKAPADSFCRGENLRIKFYAPENNSAEDTVFVAVHCGTGSTESCWFALGCAIQSDNGLRYEVIVAPSAGPFRFDIDTRFDIEGDGYPEFLVLEDWRASVYTLRNGRLVLRVSSDYRGC